MSTVESVSAIFQDRLAEAIAVLGRMQTDEVLQGRLCEAAELITQCLRDGGRVLLCGNGGSAADAQHFAAELVGKFMLHRRAYAAIALGDNNAAVTAIGNDYSYEDVFSRAVEAHGREGDVLIGISTSGTSANVVRALKAAKEIGVTSVALLGPGTTPMSQAADIALNIDGPNTARIQEGQKVLAHTLFEIVEQRLVAGDA